MTEVVLESAKPVKLTAKQQAFVNEYIIDLNATQAAIRAGYSEDTAGVIGNENLQKPYLAAAIQKAMDMRSERTAITADRVLVEIARMGFADIRQIFTAAGQLKDIATLPDEVAAAVQQVEVVTKPSADVDKDGNREVEYVHKIKLADKKGSLEMLAKHLVLFADKLEITGKDGAPLIPVESDIASARRIAFALAAGLKAGGKDAAE
jgi:phage terminase small subunit